MKVFAAEQEQIPKSLQSSALRDQRKLLTEKIRNWESVRLIYMPGVLQIQTDLGQNPTALWLSNPNPEDVPLWLPSQIPIDKHQTACREGLPEMEARLRTAQCDSSLNGLRRTLRVKTRMGYFKNKNVRGQREGTRSRAIIDRVHKRAIRFVQKYRAARKAKLDLEGPGDWEITYRELRNEDVRGYASGKPKKQPLRRGIWEDGHGPAVPDPSALFDDETDSEESDPDLNDGTEAGPLRTKNLKKRKHGTGETRKELSWIWKTARLSDDEEIHDDDILRAEWSRSRARVRRCKEEVMLLREEMRRTIEFLDWKAAQWETRMDAREDADEELAEGIQAYATEQAALQRNLCSSFKVLFKTPLAEVDNVLQQIDNGTNGSDHEGENEGDDEEDDDEPDNEPDNAEI